LNSAFEEIQGRRRRNVVLDRVFKSLYDKEYDKLSERSGDRPPIRDVADEK